MLSIFKRFTFSYAHSLPEYDGPCSNIHGHTADLVVEVCGPPIGWGPHTQYDTMVFDFNTLKVFVDDQILSVLDHQHLTNDNFNGFPPTAEVISVWIWSILQCLFGDNLVSIKMSEGPNNWVSLVNDKDIADLADRYGFRGSLR